MTPVIRTVLFDLDGTLVDSAPDMAAAVDRLLADHGRAPAGEALVRDWVGNGARRLVARALTGRRDGELPQREADAAVERFLTYYAERLHVLGRLYPGARCGLDHLRADGYRLGCVTNKPEGLARRLVAELGLADHLPVVVGGDTVAARKPDAAPLHHAMQALGATPAATLMVGDSRADVEAGRRAGTLVACVPYGYSQGEDVRAMGPDLVVESIRALRDRLAADAPGAGSCA